MASSRARPGAAGGEISSFGASHTHSTAHPVHCPLLERPLSRAAASWEHSPSASASYTMPQHESATADSLAQQPSRSSQAAGRARSGTSDRGAQHPRSSAAVVRQ